MLICNTYLCTRLEEVLATTGDALEVLWDKILKFKGDGVRFTSLSPSLFLLTLTEQSPCGISLGQTYHDGWETIRTQSFDS